MGQKNIIKPVLARPIAFVYLIFRPRSHPRSNTWPHSPIASPKWNFDLTKADDRNKISAAFADANRKLSPFRSVCLWVRLLFSVCLCSSFFLSVCVGCIQRTLTYFVRGSITVKLTSCLTGLGSTKHFEFNIGKAAKSKLIKQEEFSRTVILPLTKSPVVSMRLFVSVYKSTQRTFSTLSFFDFITHQCDQTGRFIGLWATF